MSSVPEERQVERVEFSHEVTAYQPNELISEAWTGPLAGRSESRFSAHDSGTRLSVHMEVQPSGVLKVLSPMMRGWAQRALRKDFARFEDWVAASDCSKPGSTGRCELDAASEDRCTAHMCRCGRPAYGSGVTRFTYEWLYRVIRLLRIPISFVFGTHPELQELVESGRLRPGRAIDLGCGAGRESVYLAQQGFEVTGVDYSSTAIGMATRAAREAGVEVRFVVDDLTNLRRVQGTFDVLVDYGAINDLKPPDRDRYLANVVPLARPGSRFVLRCFDNRLPRDEVEERFGKFFDIDVVTAKIEAGFRRTISTYLMTRQ